MTETWTAMHIPLTRVMTDFMVTLPEGTIKMVVSSCPIDVTAKIDTPTASSFSLSPPVGLDVTTWFRVRVSRLYLTTTGTHADPLVVMAVPGTGHAGGKSAPGAQPGTPLEETTEIDGFLIDTR